MNAAEILTALEPTTVGVAAYCDKLGEPRTIAELTKERLRRAAKTEFFRRVHELPKGTAAKQPVSRATGITAGASSKRRG